MSKQSRKRYIRMIWSSNLSQMLLSILICISLYQMYHRLAEERVASSREAEYVRLGNQLAKASDDLTNAVREYVVTLDPKYLEDYWHELLIAQNRKKVLQRLRILNAPENEIQLLDEAKYNSDDLVNTETRGMKLVLTVVGVPKIAMPKDVQNYKLSARDQRLTPEQKINTARMIMFDKKYYQDKEKIMRPIHQFQILVRERAKRERLESARRTNLIFNVTIALVVILLLVSIADVLVAHKLRKAFLERQL
ncbi:MAG: hypothetical protein K0U12_07895 [Gammaproteobacteria bacterium]|nr:hypothetical protein [Gammaproteobacteria bacterium]